MESVTHNPSPSRQTGGLRGWAWLGFWVGLLCLFAFWVGPWLQNRIPNMDRIVQLIEERDIDSGAYFYTEIEASYDGERYLRETLKFGNPPPGAGLNPAFIGCVVLCILILVIGFKTLPDD